MCSKAKKAKDEPVCIDLTPCQMWAVHMQNSSDGVFPLQLLNSFINIKIPEARSQEILCPRDVTHVFKPSSILVGRLIRKRMIFAYWPFVGSGTANAPYKIPVSCFSHLFAMNISMPMLCMWSAMNWEKSSNSHVRPSSEGMNTNYIIWHDKNATEDPFIYNISKYRSPGSSISRNDEIADRLLTVSLTQPIE